MVIFEILPFKNLNFYLLYKRAIKSWIGCKEEKKGKMWIGTQDVSNLAASSMLIFSGVFQSVNGEYIQEQLLLVNSISPALTAKHSVWAAQHIQETRNGCPYCAQNYADMHISSFSQTSFKYICTIPLMLPISDIFLWQKAREQTNVLLNDRVWFCLFFFAGTCIEQMPEKSGLLWGYKSFNAWTRAFAR